MAKMVKAVMFAFDISYRYKVNRDSKDYDFGHFYHSSVYIKDVLEKFYETYGSLESLQITDINAEECYRDKNFY